MKSVVRNCILLLATIYLGISTVQAATFTVDTTDDSVDANIGNGTCEDAGGKCSLRAAIQEANNSAGADTVILPEGVFRLSIAGTGEDIAATGDIDITNPVTVRGAARESSVVDGSSMESIFHIPNDSAVTVMDLTLRNGGDAAANGGGINSAATSKQLTVDNVLFLRNVGAMGGAVSADGPLSASGSIFQENSSSSDGGAIYVSGTGALSVTMSSFERNFSAASGGTISNTSTGSVTVANSDFSNSRAASTGGCMSLSSASNLSLTDATFINCDANSVGGAVFYASASAVTFTRVMIEDSSAVSGGAGAFFSGAGETLFESTTITGAESAVGLGGAIYFASGSGGFTFKDSTISGARVGSAGGGMYLAMGLKPATIINSTIRDSYSLAPGGGIFCSGASQLTIQDSTISGNIAGSNGGGGIFDTASTSVSILNSSIISNVALTATGGGVYRSGPNGTVIEGSTIANNAALGANGQGGGIFESSGTTATILNSTVSGNYAGVKGGGLYSSSPVEVSFSTFANNSSFEGGGIYNDASTVQFDNSIIALSQNGDNCAGAAAFSADFNIDDDGSCAFGEAGDLMVDPKIESLADNGGSTFTHTLMSTSPAVDSADNGSAPSEDQRGISRPFDGDQNGTSVSDRGSVEYNDLCPNDDAKLVPGTCGCGVADEDANGNGIIDCLVTDELKAALQTLSTESAELKAPKKKNKAQRAPDKQDIQDALTVVEGIVTTSGGSINLSDTSKSVTERLGAVQKGIRKLLRAKKARKFKKAKKKALLAIQQFTDALA